MLQKSIPRQLSSVFFANPFEAAHLCAIPFSAGPGLPSGFRGPCRSRWTGAGYGLFLISLKAVGTGLNLVAADIVIHFDPWWNQAAQDQTTDRAHRIGQQAHVQVYKLIAKDTIEEKILELQEKKAALMDTISGAEDGGIPNMSKEDLLALLTETV